MMRLDTARAREEKKKEYEKCNHCQTLESFSGEFPK